MTLGYLHVVNMQSLSVALAYKDVCHLFRNGSAAYACWASSVSGFRFVMSGRAERTVRVIIKLVWQFPSVCRLPTA
jgi:hypothetical protein